MKTLNKYIYAQFIKYFVSVFIVTISMVWLTQSLRFIEYITTRGVSVFIFLKITLQLIVPMVYFILPIVAMIAIIALMCHFYWDREIIILRNAGLSNLQIIKPVVNCCIVIALLHYSISFYFLPKTYRDFKDSREYYKNKFVTLLLEEGVFNTQSNDLTVYIGEKASDNYLKGIFINDMRLPGQLVTIIAESGYIVKTDLGPEFVLYNGTYQKKGRHNDISITTFNSYKFRMHQLEPGIISSRTPEPNELFIHQLFLNPGHAGNQSKNHIVEGNQRLIWPLYTVILPILVGAAVLAGQFNRRSALAKVSLAIVLGTFFVLCSLLFNSLATKHLWMLAFMYLNLFFILLVSNQLLKDKSQI